MLPLLTRLEEVVEEAERSSRQVRGRLRVNVNPAFGRLVPAIRLGAFFEAYPDLQLELIARNDLGDLVADGFDAAIRFGRQETSTLAASKLFEVRVVTRAAPEYLQRCGHPRQPRDPVNDAHECLLLRNPATDLPYPWDFVRGHRRLAALPVTGRLIVNDAQTYVEACTAGLGVAQLLHLGIGPLFKAGQLVDLFPDWPDDYFPLWACHPCRQFVSSKLHALLDFLKSPQGDDVGIKRS